ncbi:MFS transporter [Martelella alba]|uniref:MFS transporter n=1 Tax=Martelella alba TaxID=2590451 RepID=A0A506UE21_9HYPH|nr:MFS transporter [Martelella alba]TPW31636.1 MFS transporter [Martelella alba]
MNPIVPLILAVALFMEQMDSTVIATALPAIAADLHVGPITLKLALTAYMVALAIFIPISGWMADRFGAKLVFRTAIAVFLTGSAMCAFSGSLSAFVISRFLQGMGGAMMTPVGRLVILRTTSRTELVRAMALLTIPGLVGPLAGPPLGGFITTYFTWHWIFLINIPIGILGLILTSIYLPKIEAERPPPIDWTGFVLLATAASGVVFGLSVISMPALPPAVGISTTVIGCGATLWYIIHARKVEKPLLDLKLFAVPTFRTAILAGTFFRIAAGAFPFLLPLMLQIGFGFTPFQSGMTTFIGAIGAIATKFIAPRVLAFAGFKRLLLTTGTLGALLMFAIGLIEPTTPTAVILGVLLISGFTRSFFFTSINVLAYADIDGRAASQATAMSSTIQQVSLALGVAFAAVVLEISSLFAGTALSVAQFHVAFHVVAICSALAVVPILTLTRESGANVSGQNRHGAAEGGH